MLFSVTSEPIVNDYQKYFVSQHFGKSLGTVDMADTDGSVTISPAQDDCTLATFNFRTARLAQFVKSPDLQCETALRIAIQQAHKTYVQHGAECLSAGVHELALETPPWIGDLTEVQYGGATSGYESLVATALAGRAGRATHRPA